ncbi:MAG: hypothetical protein GX994_01180 [Firmicutes bacterium]|nr:hypothetical protein [Bacillota bacterium]
MVDKKEVLEAKAVANQVLDLLNDVEKQLKSAKNWGIFDLLGGGFLSSVIKHGKIDKAESLLKMVHKELVRLQKELGDINLSIDSSIKISDFDRFLDIVFDNVISDWMTQSKVNDSLNEVARVKVEINRVLETLSRIEEEYSI